MAFYVIIFWGDYNMRAVLYTRVSTTMQVTDGASLQQQEERLKAYAVCQGWEIVNMYQDAGLSGKDTNRPAFKQMIEDAENKMFDAIIVYKLDRLTRSVKDFHTLSDKLDKLGISLVSVTQNLDTSSSVGRLLRNILVDFANFEREMISERTMDSKLALAAKGHWLGGKSPFGYNVVNKQLILDEEKGEVVKLMYKDYIDGLSTRQIMKKHTMTFSSVIEILKNPLYCGLIGYCKKDRNKRKDHADWIIAKGTHIPVVTEDEYWNVQKLFKERFSIPKPRFHHQIFEALCYCGKCNKKLYFQKGEERYKYYRCAPKNIVTSTGCGFSIHENKLEIRVISKLTELINNNTYWEEIEQSIKTKNKSENNSKIKSLEKEYDKNKKIIKNLIMQMSVEEAKLIAHLIVPEVSKIETRNKELLMQLEDLKKEYQKDISIKNFKSLVKDSIYYYEKMTIEEKRNYLKLIIKQIIVSKENIIVKLNDDIGLEVIC